MASTRHHRAKATKRGGKGDGESERLSTTGEAGEPTRGTPRREEGRRDTELLEGKTTEPLTSGTVSTRLQRIAELAREDPKRAFRSLAHHIDLEFLQEAFRRTRKDGATGVDGQTSGEYEERLEENLRSLLDRFKSGQYKAPPVRRTYVPKGDGKQQRPIGIPTFEDKVLQRAVTMVLGAVYEQEFLTCSYGYRPGRSAHQALTDLRQELMVMGGGWVLENSGQPLDGEALYSVLVKDYMYAGGDGYTLLAEADPAAYQTGIDWRQPVIDWILAQESSPDAPLDAAIATLEDN